MPSRTIQSRNYAAGTRTIDFPASATKRFGLVEITLTRENWPLTPNDVVLTFSVEFSLDGVTWEQQASFSANGGVLLNKDGSVQDTTYFAFRTKDADGTTLFRGGDLRAVITNTESLRTAITLTYSD